MKSITKDKYSSKTMTVKELIEKLLEYPMSMPVLATWDDLRVGIRPENFYIANEPDTGWSSKEQLIIDVSDFH